MEDGSNWQNKGQNLVGPSEMYPSSICGLAIATDTSTPPAKCHNKVAAQCTCCRLLKNATHAARVKPSDSLASRLVERPRLTAIEDCGDPHIIEPHSQIARQLAVGLHVEESTELHSSELNALLSILHSRSATTHNTPLPRYVNLWTFSRASLPSLTGSFTAAMTSHF